MKGWFGRLIRTPAQRRSRRIEQALRQARESIKEDPQNPHLYRRLAEIYQQKKQWVPALAALRSSHFLEGGHPETERIMALVNNRISVIDPSTISHNLYYRHNTLANHCRTLFPDVEFSLLDVGGGKGWLSYFLPQARYMLADPLYNGIDWVDLPFDADCFDVVAACHVLEHIPIPERERFLAKLCSISAKYVLLLNPFAIPGTLEKERLRLLLDITGYDWVQEHLACTLPELEWIKRYASSQGYPAAILPNGSLTTSLTLVLLDYFAKRGDGELMGKINRFLNSRFSDIMTHPDYPVAYLIEIRVDGKGKYHG